MQRALVRGTPGLPWKATLTSFWILKREEVWLWIKSCTLKDMTHDVYLGRVESTFPTSQKYHPKLQANSSVGSCTEKKQGTEQPERQAEK